MAGPAVAAMLYFSFCMTIDAPRHPHRHNTGNTVHRFHGTMTFLAFEVGLDVPFMRKVNKVGNVMYLDPRNRLTVLPVGGELQNFRLITNARHGLVAPHAFTDAGNAGRRRPVGIDVTVLARNFVVRGMHRVTEFNWLNRTAVRKIFAVYPCAYEQSDHHHQPDQGWLRRGPERVENRDRQMGPPLLGQEFARKLAKLQIDSVFVAASIPGGQNAHVT